MKKQTVALSLIALLIFMTAGCALLESPVPSAAQALEQGTPILPESPAAAASPEISQAPETAAPPATGKLTAAQAEEIALNHAGLTQSQVENLRSHQDYDDGAEEYEVKFRSGEYDYDYSIDAYSGQIRSQDKEYEGPPAASAQGERITAEEAQSIALAHAGFTADQVTRLSAQFEPEEPGDVAHYDVEFYQGSLEYDYEIDAYTGEIISQEKDRD